VAQRCIHIEPGSQPVHGRARQDSCYKIGAQCSPRGDWIRDIEVLSTWRSWSSMSQSGAVCRPCSWTMTHRIASFGSGLRTSTIAPAQHIGPSSTASAVFQAPPFFTRLELLPKACSWYGLRCLITVGLATGCCAIT
jgi:hypothetical protein